MTTLRGIPAIAPFPTRKSYLTPFPTKALISDLRKYVQIGLTCTTGNGTNEYREGGNELDATTRKLVQRMQELELQRSSIDRELRALMTALSVVGIKPKHSIGNTQLGGMFNEMPTQQEGAYISKQLFADKSLKECCETVLREHSDKWLSKAEIEYLIVRGGYAFSTDNSKNSVGITLRRMAQEGLCDAQRARGASGNRYRYHIPVQASKT